MSKKNFEKKKKHKIETCLEALTTRNEEPSKKQKGNPKYIYYWHIM